METYNLPTLKQKVKSSRKIWASYQCDKFIDTLYKNPVNYEIISWNDDGSHIEIKNEGKFVAQILPLFSNCPTFTVFKQKLEDCLFIEVIINGSQPGSCFYEHLNYTRDSRPREFNERMDANKKKRVRRAKARQSPPAMGTVEWYLATRKLLHKENTLTAEGSQVTNENDDVGLGLAERQLFNEMNVHMLALDAVMTTIKTLREENLLLKELVFNSTLQSTEKL